MLISVVIPLSRGRFGTRLRNCLHSVRRCQAPPTAEIILSLLHPKGDDLRGDLKALETLAEKVQARIITTENPHEKWSPGLARNAGFRVATGSVWASLDADAVIHPRTLALAMDHGRHGRAIRVPTVMRPEGPSWHGFRDVTKFEEMTDGPVAPGPGSFISAPGAVVNHLRGWDEDYLGYGCCDHDWIERLQQSGCKVVNVGKTEGVYALHQHHARQITPELRACITQNRERFALTKSRALKPTRNPEGWGGRQGQ